MEEIIYFRTYSYKENKEVEVRNFETIELAKQDSLKDKHNTYFHLFEITMIFNGRITETKKSLGQITCARDIEEFEKNQFGKKI